MSPLSPPRSAERCKPFTYTMDRSRAMLATLLLCNPLRCTRSHPVLVRASPTCTPHGQGLACCSEAAVQCGCGSSHASIANVRTGAIRACQPPFLRRAQGQPRADRMRPKLGTGSACRPCSPTAQNLASRASTPPLLDARAGSGMAGAQARVRALSALGSFVPATTWPALARRGQLFSVA